MNRVRMNKVRLLVCVGAVCASLGVLAPSTYADDDQPEGGAAVMQRQQAEEAMEAQRAAEQEHARDRDAVRAQEREAAEAQQAMADADLTNIVAMLTDPTAQINALMNDTNIDPADFRLVNVALVPTLADAEDASELDAALSSSGVTSDAQAFLSTSSSPAASAIDSRLSSAGISISRVLGLVDNPANDQVLVFFR